MRKTVNRNHIEGYLYQHKLEKKVTGPNSKAPNTTYIGGTVDLATDNELTNIVTVHFTYVTPTTKEGKDNRTFRTLANIIDGTLCSVMAHGKDKAHRLAIDSAMDANEFYSDRSGELELVSAMRNEGGFISTVDALNEKEQDRATFDTDIIIYKVSHMDADEEKDLPEKAVVSGYVMNFRKDFIPVKYSVLNPNAIDYFEGLEASEKNPVFTHVRGRQISTIVVKKVVEEGAFGESYVREYPNSHKDFVITWAKSDPYEIGDNADISIAEIKKGLADRQTMLATKKKEREDYLANKVEASAFATPSKDEKFDF